MLKTVMPSLLFAILVVYGPPLNAQNKSNPKTSTLSSELFGGMEWRQVGPFRGGRAGTCQGVKDSPLLYYMGTAGGGVWKTEDGGNTWGCISDGYFGGSIGAVAVAPSDPNVIYVGEGEQTLRGNVSSGWGLWKSTDAGATWKHIGLDKTEHIGRIIIHPDNPDLLYVAAIGNLWKPNPERGLYRSQDGGTSWELILFESDKAGAVDVAFDPNNPRILYATTWQMKRNGYRMDSGGPGSHLWKSTDGGESWQQLDDSPGLPPKPWGILGVTVSPVNSDRVWIIIEAENGGVFRSDDAGKTYSKVNEDRGLRQRAWYYSRIYADSQDEEIVYVMNVSFWKSKDGGKTFNSIRTPHGDHHDLWIAPGDNQRMVVADDGGAQVTTDGGANWTTYHNQPTAQFYRVTTDNHFPFRIYGAQQDNSTIRILHRSDGSSINESHWESTAGGESAHLAPDPEDPEIVFGGTYKGYMMRKDHRTGQTRSVNVWPFNPAGSGAEVMKYRFNWNFPIYFSPNDPDRLYATSNHVHVTYNEGQTWEEFSPDLTRNDPETIRSSGGPITQDNTGAEFYANIFAITESMHERGVIWTGSDDGLVHVTRDDGKTWQNVTPPNSPRLNMINCIEMHPTKPGGVYIAATHYKFGDYTPYLYKTENYGKTWETITNGIDQNHYTRAIRADKVRPGLLYAGTEWGMYLSFDDGKSWNSFQLNLPITAIRDLHLRDNMLIAATHGRSFWMIDDLSPIQQISPGIADKSHHIYLPKPAYRMAGGGRGGNQSKLTGTNHPNGVLLNYFVQELNHDDEVILEILENDGSLIRKYSNKAKESNEKLEVESGGNRFVWDMRYPGFTEFPGMVLYASPNRGPKAVPGQYQVRLSVNENSVEQTIEILKDPRLETTIEELQQQFDYLIRVRDKVSSAHQAILDIRSLREDLNYIKGKLTDRDEASDIKVAIKELEQKISAIENDIHMTKNKSRQDPLNYGLKVNNRLAFLMADAQRGDYAPTDAAYLVEEQLTEELNEYLQDFQEVKEKDLLKVSQMIDELGISLISISEKVKKP